MEAERVRVITEEENITLDEEIDAIDRELERIRGNSFLEKPVQKPHNHPDIKSAIGLQNNKEHKQNKPAFLTPKQIKSPKRDLSKVISSGIDLLDKRIIGFNPGELSIWSGSNGSGKSSILSQIALEGINQNFNIALFSGELRADRVMNWLQLQGAGKRYAESTQYENYYTVPERIKSKIDEWLDCRMNIYDNDCGTDAIGVLNSIRVCVEKKNVSMVIIDNMMSLDLAAVSGERYEKQTSLVLALCELAKQTKTHIHFVAHPRKSMGFLRKNDISGTADITNAADNVFIVHRVNSDFKRNTKQDLGLKEDNPLYNFSNVIEICKNRDLGIADEFVGLHFEKESKRFLNSRDGSKRYGWEADNRGFITVDDNEKLPFDD